MVDSADFCLQEIIDIFIKSCAFLYGSYELLGDDGRWCVFAIKHFYI